MHGAAEVVVIVLVLLIICATIMMANRLLDGLDACFRCVGKRARREAGQQNHGDATHPEQAKNTPTNVENRGLSEHHELADVSKSFGQPQPLSDSSATAQRTTVPNSGTTNATTAVSEAETGSLTRLSPLKNVRNASNDSITVIV